MWSTLAQHALSNHFQDLPQGSCRHTLAKVINSRRFDVFVLSLVLIDVALVAVEVGIDHRILCISGREVATPDLWAGVDQAHFLQGTLDAAWFPPRGTGKVRAGTHDPHSLELALWRDVSPAPEEKQETVLVCLGRHAHTTEVLLEIARTVGGAILSFFMVELLAKVWLGPREFFSNFFHVVDLVVVSVSWCLFVALENAISNELVEESGQLLVVFRVWRLIRIVHGFSEILEEHRAELDECRKMARTAKARAETVGESASDQTLPEATPEVTGVKE